MRHCKAWDLFYRRRHSRSGAGKVRILHGTGTGILRQLIRDYLRTVPVSVVFKTSMCSSEAPASPLLNSIKKEILIMRRNEYTHRRRHISNRHLSDKYYYAGEHESSNRHPSHAIQRTIFAYERGADNRHLFQQNYPTRIRSIGSRLAD